MPPITFTDDDFHGLDHQQDDPMVITVEIENYAIKKVLIDQGSSVDILYWATYQKLQLPNTTMVPYDELIYGFSGEKVSIPFFAMAPKQRQFLSDSLSSTRPRLIMSSSVDLHSTLLALSSPHLIWP